MQSLGRRNSLQREVLQSSELSLDMVLQVHLDYKEKNQRHASPPHFSIACADVTQFQLVQLGSTVRCPEDLHNTDALEIMQTEAFIYKMG